MAKGKLALKLAKLGKKWNQAKERKDDYGPGLPDGRYLVKLANAEVAESQSERLQIHIEVVVKEGDNKGETHHFYNGLDTEDGMFYAQKMLKRLGKDVPEDPESLEDVCKELTKEKPDFLIDVKTKGEYSNTYVKGLAEAEDAEDEEESDDEGEAEDSDDSDADEDEESDDDADEDSDEEDDDSDESEDDDEDEDEPEEDEVEVSVGSKVKTPKGVGKVLELDDKKGEALVKVNGVKKRFAFDKLAAV